MTMALETLRDPTGAAPAAGPAPYACDPRVTRGRIHAETASPSRSDFQRDRDRIIHSTAFRKLKHKTQVFVYHEGDYYRTRLTHSLEVAQIARSVSRALGLNEDLAEAVALAHDLGHTPFGHAGEDALDPCMKPWGGFRHNDHTLRILTYLEKRYAEFDGLNLTWETLEGVVKHNGPVTGAAARSPTIREFQAQMDLELDTWPSAEAQVAAIADDIAYNNHDLDDGIRARLFTLDDLAGLPLIGPIITDLRQRYPSLEQGRLVNEVIRRLIDAMVTDLIAESARRIAALNPRDAAAIRAAGKPVIGFSDQMRAHDKAIRTFLAKGMYDHYRVNRMYIKARRVIHDLFDLFMAEPQILPTDWRLDLRKEEEKGGDPMAARARIVSDYIAGMTDRYALTEHNRLFDIFEKA